MPRSNALSGKRRTTLTLLGLPLVLAACAGSIQSSTEPPVLEEAPSELTGNCPQPVILPERMLMQAEVEEFWLRDRVALIDCGARKAALESYYARRDEAIRGKPQ